MDTQQWRSPAWFCSTVCSPLANRSTESDSEVDGRGGGGASHGTAAELEKAQGGVERSRFSPGRIAQFKELAADPSVYDKVWRLPSRAWVG